MNTTRRQSGPATVLAAAAVVVAVGAPLVHAVRIGDVARFQGEFPNKVMGMGLVVGLAGTGDGGDYMPAMRPLSKLLARMANPVSLTDELKDANNVAIVMVEAMLPADGVREGTRVDVQISSIGAAKSLAGGRLVLTPLLSAGALAGRASDGGPAPEVLAFASGPVTVSDPKAARVGVVRQGATIETNILHHYIAYGNELDHFRQAVEQGGAASESLLHWLQPDAPYVTLVVDPAHASWAMTSMIAQIINDSMADPNLRGRQAPVQEMIAMAVDRNNVLVRVPETARENMAPFLRRLETMDLLMPESEARVIVNRSKGSVIISGDVEISPVTITFRGLTIQTVTPPPKPTAEAPLVEQKQFAPLDPSDVGGAKLRDLVTALNSLKLPPEDRVHIIEELHRLGKLHAKLIVEE